MNSFRAFFITLLLIIASTTVDATPLQGQLEIHMVPYSEREVSLAQMTELDTAGVVWSIQKAVHWNWKEHQWTIGIEGSHHNETTQGYDFSAEDSLVHQQRSHSTFRWHTRWTSPSFTSGPLESRLFLGGSFPQVDVSAGWQIQAMRDPLRVDANVQLQHRENAWHWSGALGSTLAVNHHWQWSWQVKNAQRQLWLECGLLQNHRWGQTTYFAAANPGKSRWQLGWRIAY